MGAKVFFWFGIVCLTAGAGFLLYNTRLRHSAEAAHGGAACVGNEGRHAESLASGSTAGPTTGFAAIASDLTTVSGAQAIERFGLRERLERFAYRDGTGQSVRVHEGDLQLAGDLVLDFNDRMQAGKIVNDPTWQGAQGLVVTGNLIMDGSVINAGSDYGAFLYVKGNLTAANLVGGGSEIAVAGDADISGLVLGHYNHGRLVIEGETTAGLVISDDHATDISTTAPVWDSHEDVVAMPLAEYLHSDLASRLEQDEHDETGLTVFEAPGAEEVVAHLRSGESALRQPGDSRSRTHEEAWRRAVRAHGMAIRHAPAS